MPRKINGQLYYGTSEVCQKVGVSRATLFRWLRQGILNTIYTDRRGWRIFTDDDLNKIHAEVNRIEVKHISHPDKYARD